MARATRADPPLVGALLRVRDLVVSDKIKILDDPETVVIAIEHPRAEEVAVVAPVEGETEAEPEVIKKGKVAEPTEEEEEK